MQDDDKSQLLDAKTAQQNLLPRKDLLRFSLFDIIRRTNKQ